LAEGAGELEVSVARGQGGRGGAELDAGGDAVLGQLRAGEQGGDRQGGAAVLERVAREVMREGDEERVDPRARAAREDAARAEGELAYRDRRGARILAGAAREGRHRGRGELDAGASRVGALALERQH